MESEEVLNIDPNQVIDSLITAYQTLSQENVELKLKLAVLEATVRSLRQAQSVAE
jgi:cell division septum initiation protein DivIVA